MHSYTDISEAIFLSDTQKVVETESCISHNFFPATNKMQAQRNFSLILKNCATAATESKLINTVMKALWMLNTDLPNEHTSDDT